MIGTYANYQTFGKQTQDTGSAGLSGANARVTGAIRNASAETGVDFNYLMQQANVESGMNPSAKARTSSATGLYQFIEQTWLRTMKQHGAEHGYTKEANAIHQKSNGQYAVSDRATRNSILNLRKDPTAASLMAAELATENHDYLRSKVGQEPGKTDLYMAHFLGAGGAASFLKKMNQNPSASAANLFPEAARANKSVFYANGRQLSLQQVYNRFENKFDDAGSNTPVVQTARIEGTLDQISTQAVSLPQANSWARPGRAAIVQDVTENTYVPTPRTLGGFFRTTRNDVLEDTQAAMPTRYISSPVAIMEMAQETMKHNDNSRYNS